MMSELYYRNSAGHAYADYDVNKIKLFVNNESTMESAIDPNTIYPIDQLMSLVAQHWYGQAEGTTIPAEKLLSRSGGPFDYDTIVYLGTPPRVYACSGGLGSLIDNPRQHAPFSAHFMYGTYVE
jgi:hypothetical protein